VDRVESAAGDLVGLHSSDPATVFLSARARVRDFEVGALEDALYEARSLVRMLGMRRTMFVVPLDLAAVMDDACTKALAPAERARLIRLVSEQIEPEAEAWVDDVAARTLAALERRGQATARELTADVPQLGAKLSFGDGTRWAGTVGMSTRVLFLLATEGAIVRGRPLGAWTSSQYRWATTTGWLGGPLPSGDRDDAAVELLRRWLARFGPATRTDIRWWTGWTARLTDQTLAAIEAVEVGLDPTQDGPATGYVLPDDLEEEPVSAPWVAFLPGLDPTTMGWKERHWYLGPHAAELFDRNGNAGPTVWVDGRVVGGWAQTDEGDVAVQHLEAVATDAADAIERERTIVREWLGDVRVRPRFRTPLERRLSSAEVG
jgi:hypothetical protein